MVWCARILCNLRPIQEMPIIRMKNETQKRVSVRVSVPVRNRNGPIRDRHFATKLFCHRSAVEFGERVTNRWIFCIMICFATARSAKQT